MKRVNFTLVLLLLLIAGSSQGWSPMPDMPTGVRYGGVGVGIGVKGYIGMGADGIAIRGDWWELNTQSKVWTQKADFPGVARMSPIAFSIGDKVFVGTGLNMYTVYADFYQYDTAQNNWTRKADYEGGPRYGAMSFSIGNKGYVGGGKDQGLYSGTSDFWEYDPVTDDWTRKADMGATNRSYAAAFSIGQKGYIGLGAEVYDTRKKDLWEYDPVADIWVQKADFPGTERFIPFSFALGNKGYVGFGTYYSSLADFWEYNPTINAWTQLDDFIPRSQGVSFTAGDKGYIGTGYNDTYGSNGMSDFWEFSATPAEVTICDQTWTQKNLTVTKYRNGDPIPQVTDNSEWVSLTTGAWCYYNNDPATEATYGKLYNWYAVTDPRGLAPDGWHIPDYGEWITLENCVGTYFTAGGILKETGTVHWADPNTGATDAFGFTALPGGMRTPPGSYSQLGQVGNWWSSSSGSYSHYGSVFTGGYYRSIFYGSAIFYGNQAYMGYPSYPIMDYKTGMSVRCVKDQPPVFTACPSPLIVYADSFGCTKTVVYTANASGNPAPALTYTFTGATQASGSGTGTGLPFNRGLTHVLITATNTAGTTNCTFSVEVKDTIKPVLICPPGQEFCFNSSYRYTIPLLQATDNCGIKSISYNIYGATTRSGNGNDASGVFYPGSSIIQWKVTDSADNISYCSNWVRVLPALHVTFPDVYTAVLGRPNTVYIGYGFYYRLGYGFNFVVLTPIPSGGTPFYTSLGVPYYHYQWSNGSTLPGIVLSFNSPGYYTYSVTITDAKGCSITVSKTIRVVDVRCNKNVWGITVKGVNVCRPGGVTKCVYEFLVWAEVLNHAEIGPCGAAKEAPYQLKQEEPAAKVQEMRTETENSWAAKAAFPAAGRFGAIGFSIGNKGYTGLGMGLDDELYKDFWEYNPVTNVWTQKADFGGTARGLATAFSIGNKGYAGTGVDADGWRKDFWQYDPASNRWTRKADFGGTARAFATGLSINGKGYIGTGYDQYDSLMNDFWEYRPLTNNWVRKADFGGSERYAATGFSLNGKGYIGTGLDIEGPTRDFWQYDPQANIWTRKADFTGYPRHLAAGFTIGCRGYIGTGLDSTNTIRADWWEYDPAADQWNEQAALAGGARLNASGFSIGGRSYITGGISMEGLNADLWEYTAGCNLNVSIPDVYAVLQGGEKNTIYLGYGSPFLVLSALPSCGNLQPGGNYQYTWSTGSEWPLTLVSPDVPGAHTYTVTVSDNYGCSATASITINVVDIRCGNNKVKVCYIPAGNPANRKTICVNKLAVPVLLLTGSRLGECDSGAMAGRNLAVTDETDDKGAGTIQVYPNPNRGSFNVKLPFYSGGELKLVISDAHGSVVKAVFIPAGKGYDVIHVELGQVAQGMYIIRVEDKQNVQSAKMVVW